MHGDHVGACFNGRRGSTCDLMRNIVALQVEEYLIAQKLEDFDDGRAFGVIQRHADFEPLGLALQRNGKIERLGTGAVERDDNAVGAGNAFKCC